MLNVQRSEEDRTSCRRVLFLTTGLALWALAGPFLVAVGASPVLDYVFPAGGQAGSRFEVQPGVSAGTEPLRLWSDAPGIGFRASDPGRFEIHIPPGTPAGVREIRAVTPGGASPPRAFLVGAHPERVVSSVDATRGDLVLNALPLTVNARFSRREEIHVFAVPAAAGETLIATAVSWGLDLPLRTRLAWRDPSGAVAAAAEAAGGAADPVLPLTVSAGGLLRVEVGVANDSSDGPPDPFETGAAIYRLTLTRGPAAPTAPAKPPPDGFAPPIVSDAALQSLETARLPASVGGALSPPGEVDRYQFTASRGYQYAFGVEGMNPDSALFAGLTVWDSAGHLLAGSPPSTRPGLLWTAPVNGSYVLALADARVVSPGGSLCSYRLDVSAPLPLLAAAIAENTFEIGPGGKVGIPVQVTRPRELNGVLLLIADGLPTGVEAEPLTVGPEAKQLELRLSARRNAPSAGQAFQVLLSLVSPTEPRTVLAEAPVRAMFADPGERLLERTPNFWLTVRDR